MVDHDNKIVTFNGESVAFTILLEKLMKNWDEITPKIKFVEPFL